MIVCFLFLAGLYVLVGNPLVAGAQVLVYIGAISVLILFAVMLTQSKAGPARLVFHHQAWAGRPGGHRSGRRAGHRRRRDQLAAGPARPQRDGHHRCRLQLFGDFVLPFEVVSVLLLAAVIGGVFLAKKDDAPRSDSDI